MKTYQQHSVQEYLDALAGRTPVPGGGSAAALVAAVGAGLISMVANYSVGKTVSKAVEKRIQKVLSRSESIRTQLMSCVDRDAQAYLGVVSARKAGPAVYKAALREARRVPREVAKLCSQAVALTPVLVRDGNPNLLSDVEVALELLEAAFKSALINVAINQS